MLDLCFCYKYSLCLHRNVQFSFDFFGGSIVSWFPFYSKYIFYFSWKFHHFSKKLILGLALSFYSKLNIFCCKLRFRFECSASYMFMFIKKKCQVQEYPTSQQLHVDLDMQKFLHTPIDEAYIWVHANSNHTSTSEVTLNLKYDSSKIPILLIKFHWVTPLPKDPNYASRVPHVFFGTSLYWVDRRIEWSEL